VNYSLGLQGEAEAEAGALEGEVEFLVVQPGGTITRNVMLLPRIMPQEGAHDQYLARVVWNDDENHRLLVVELDQNLILHLGAEAAGRLRIQATRRRRVRRDPLPRRQAPLAQARDRRNQVLIRAIGHRGLHLLGLGVDEIWNQ
jgi:hypothetical protein